MKNGCPHEWDDAVFSFAVIASNLLGVLFVCFALDECQSATATRVAPLLWLLMCTSDAIQETCIQLHGLEDGIEEEASQWSICCVAFAMGATSFLALPAAPHSRLKVVTFATTAHLQNATALLWILLRGQALSGAQRRAGERAMVVVMGIVLGVILGALALIFNPLAPPTDRWLFTVAGTFQWAILVAHDCRSEGTTHDSAGPMDIKRLEALGEPLNPATNDANEQIPNNPIDTIKSQAAWMLFFITRTRRSASASKA
eukprot:CAMPEP_0115830210 /NCGR_PEP_ID=MMETSP0287-20121206/1502_1 /TAXON_ID=412157 /ORGANISM="Chrysochromulina rotalis, Strain UIO044" /LENGTH=257 /DNA_ID=CAMNT_0003283511 /DNA_START=123 /DNA_END=896 /DNA_ORIENTATION=-